MTISLDTYLRRPSLHAATRRWDEHLDTSQMARVGRLRSVTGRARLGVGYALLREALSLHVPAIGPSDWRFTRSENGRPELSGGQADLRFNLSRTADLVAVVVTQGHECGIDVESTERLGDPDESAAGVFSQVERRTLGRAVGVERLVERWALKEAYLKGLGVGLRVPPEEITLMQAADGSSEWQVAVGSDGYPDPLWRLASSWVTPTETLAVAVRSEAGVEVFRPRIMWI